LLGALLAVAVQLYHVTAGGNFHEVIAGDVYRSAQPSAEELEALIRRYGIRTVINLRGDNAEDDWYWEEKRTAERNGAVVVDVGLWGNSPADADQLRILVRTLDHGRPPFLLHCYSGADRAGMASVVALLLRSDTGLAEARGQLAWFLGHNPLGKAGCHDRLFERYEQWLRDRQRRHAPRHLRHWVNEVYRPEICQSDGPEK
jgi:protein tyrosine/serine phosphatase